MYDYETVLVLHPDPGEAGAKDMIQRARTILEGEKAEVRKVDEWGLRELAYVIHKQRRGYYAVIEYKALPQTVGELERQLKLSDQVLRFLTVRQVHKKTLPPRRPREDRSSHEGAGEMS